MLAESSDDKAAARLPAETPVRRTSRISCINFLVAEDRPHLASEVLAEFRRKQAQERVEKSLRSMPWICGLVRHVHLKLAAGPGHVSNAPMPIPVPFVRLRLRLLPCPAWSSDSNGAAGHPD